MYARADIEQIEACILRTFHIRGHAVAYGNDARKVERAPDRLRLGKSGAIDGDIGFSGDPGLAAELFIKLGNGAGAGDQAMPALDNEIGIGADERNVPIGKCRQRCPVVLGRLGLVIVEAGADDRLGFVGGDDLGAEPFEQRQITIGTDEEDAFLALAINARVTSPEVTIR